MTILDSLIENQSEIENYGLSTKHSGVATGGSRGQSATPDSEMFAKNREKEGKNQEKEGKKRKIREERQNSGMFFHFAPPDRKGWLRY